MQVPLLDLKAQFKAIKHEIMPVLENLLDTQQFIGGPTVKNFEDAIAAYSHTKAGIAMSSGTDALVCALMALEIGPGDEVITSPYTFFATAGSITRVGAVPVFVDIDPLTYNLNPALIESAITSKTRAIMPVHLFGQMTDMDPLMAIAAKYKLFVIEDAAQSIGALYKGRHSGSIGTVGCFSFYPSKNLAGAGDGGMIVTQDQTLAQKITIFRNHGSEPKYYHKWVGGNFRLDTLQCAYLHIKLKYLDGWSAARRKNAALYNQLLAPVKQVTVPFVAPHNESIVNQYVIRVHKRDELRNFLAAQGVSSEIYYPVSLHEQECFKKLAYRRGDFPHSELAALQSLALPIFPELVPEQIHYVAAKIAEFYAS